LKVSKLHYIKPLGWVDLNSDYFDEIALECTWVISTSFSEGGGGSILNCMAKGLIPVISKSCSIDLPDNTGFYINDVTSEGLIQLLKKCSSVDNNYLSEMSKSALTYVNENHTLENFKAKYKSFLEEVIAYKLNKEINI
jgi:glycosyltransferase involved in cell wall biosynthesis